MSETAATWTAIVLAGGRSTRLGEDKARALLGGRTLLDHVVHAIPDDVICIVVGQPPASAERLLLVAIEEEPGGGPVAGTACGIEFVVAPIVVLLAVDMPFAGPVIDRVVAALETADEAIDAVIPVDAQGRRQPLAAAYRTASLRTALARLDPIRGRSMRELLDGFTVIELPIGEDDNRALLDIDTAADLDLARRTVTDDEQATSERTTR